MSTSTTLSTEFLLGQTAWIRDLARRLVADESAADDLVQEALVVALERPPRDATRLRPWFASVMRNLVRQGARGDARRRGREKQTARSEVDESRPFARRGSEELVQQVATQRTLVQAVLDLDEPYRTSLLLRYFEGLPPREIARQVGAPVATVHSRLKRALARLRESLDASHGGDRRAWVVLVAPLAERSTLSAPTATTLGALALNAKIVVTVLLVLVLGTVASLVVTGGDGGEAATRSPRAAGVASVDVTEPRHFDESDPVLRGEAPLERAPVAPERATTVTGAPAEVEPEEVASRTVIGRVLDASAAPLAGVTLRYADGEGTLGVTSGPGGRFEFRTTALEGRLVAASPDWVTIREGVDREGEYEPVVVVAPAIDLAGVVVSDSGRRLGGARIELELPDGFDTRFSQVLDRTRTRNWYRLSEPDGSFALASVPGVEGSRLVAVLDGYVAEELPAPTYPDLALTIVLERPSIPPKGVLRGRVVDPDGEPVEGARVATGLQAVLTDEDGQFHVDLARAVTPDRLTAVAEAHLPATMERPFAPSDGTTGWPDFVELELGGPPLKLAARLVTPEGRPLAGARVWLADTNKFGTIGIMPTAIESMIGGAPVPLEAAESRRMLPEQDGDNTWSFTRSGAPSTAFWHWKTTDADGRFEFTGLLDQTYRVEVLDTDSHARFTSAPLFPSAAETIVEVPVPELWAKLAGRVVDDRGRPLAGVEVTLRCDPYSRTSRVFGGTAEITMILRGESATTDEDGRFELADVPRTDMRLVFEADGIVPTSRALDPAMSDPTGLRYELDTRCHLSIELTGPLEADQFQVFDGDDGRLDIHELSEGSHTAGTHADIVAGRSGVVSVSGRARELRLLSNGVVVRTVDLDLFPGEINVVTVD